MSSSRVVEADPLQLFDRVAQLVVLVSAGALAGLSREVGEHRVEAAQEHHYLLLQPAAELEAQSGVGVLDGRWTSEAKNGRITYTSGAMSLSFMSFRKWKMLSHCGLKRAASWKSMMWWHVMNTHSSDRI